MWSFFLIWVILSTCNMPNRLGDLIRSAAPTRTSTATPSVTPSVTPTFTLTSTPTLTLTPTATSSPIPKTPTATATITPIPPSLTPALNQMTAGQDSWKLISMDYPDYISAIGRLFYPPERDDPISSYVYLRLNFACQTGKSLIELYTGYDMGLTFIYKPSGYPDVYIEDYQGRRYLVNLIGACWLATPLPRARLADPYYILAFKSLPPLKISPPQSSLNEQSPLAFVSERDLNPEIYVLKPPGTSADDQAQRLTNNPASDTHPSWSPDHNFLAFTTNRDGNSEVYRMDMHGQNLLNLTQNFAQDGGPAWSPSGDQIAFHTDRTGNWEIFVMRADGNLALNLSNSPDADINPSWSPDGRQIVFQSHRDGNWEIYVISLDGSQARRLTTHPAEDVAPSWSPDASQIAFWSRRNAGWGLYLISPSGANLKLLLEYLNPGPFASPPAWSPDGRYLIFATQRDGYLELYRLNIENPEPQRLTHNTVNDYDPDW